MKHIDIVIPIYNEADHLVDNINVIHTQLRQLDNITTHIILVDDGSHDRTAERIHEYLEDHNNINLIQLTRNFGKEAAIHAGLTYSNGDATVVMDSDLQHPPHLIKKMVQQWLEGNLVVEAVKKKRNTEPLFYRLFSWTFYRLFYILSGFDIREASDFKLLDKQVVETYLEMPERLRFFRGMICWLNYPSVKIPFNVPDREKGKSRWSFCRLVKYSSLAITSFSSAGLQLVTFFGGITLLVALIFGSIAIIQAITGHSVSGFATVILLILFIGSITMLSLGIIGTYIAHIYEEVKKRPNFIVNPVRGRSSLNKNIIQSKDFVNID